MQLDRVPPARKTPQELGPGTPLVGVEHEAETSESSNRAPQPIGRRIGGRALWAIALCGLSLLWQGERYRIDTGLTTPQRTVASFWRALRHGDETGAARCMVEGSHGLPFPGMLWFLPPTREFTLSNFQTMPVEGDHLLVTYLVRYTPVGVESEQAFVTSFEMVRQHGEWLIVRPVGEASMPEWKPFPRAVDI